MMRERCAKGVVKVEEVPCEENKAHNIEEVKLDHSIPKELAPFSLSNFVAPIDACVNAQKKMWADIFKEPEVRFSTVTDLKEKLLKPLNSLSEHLGFSYFFI